MSRSQVLPPCHCTEDTSKWKLPRARPSRGGNPAKTKVAQGEALRMQQNYFDI